MAHEEQETVVLEHEGHQWQVDPRFRQYVQTHLLEPWGGLERVDGFQVLKSNPVRAVFFIPDGETDGSGIILKQFKVRDWKERLKHMVLPSKCAAEWRASRILESKGLPTAEVLALREDRNGPLLSAGYLATRCIPGAVQFGVFASRFDNAGASCDLSFLGKKRRVLAEIGRVIRQLHDSGVYHRDLHIGNILVQNGVEGPPRVFVIDLHTAWFPGQVSRRRKVINLGRMGQTLQTFASRRDLLRALQGYLRPNEWGDWKSWWRTLAVEVKRVEQKRLVSRTNRCLKNSSKFSVERLGRFNIYARRPWTATQVMEVLNQHRQTVRERGSDVLKLSRRVAVTVARLDNSQEVVVKKNRLFWLFSPLKNIVRPSRGKRAWVVAHGFQLRQLPTPRSVAFVEERWFRVLIARTYLVTEFLRGAKPLSAYLVEQGMPLQREARAAFLDRLAHTVKQLHASGVYHRDLSAKNILVVKDSDATWQFHLVDLESVHFGRRLSERRILKNLVQLCDGLTGFALEEEIEAFIKNCLPEPMAADGETLVRKIRGKAEKRRRRAEKIIAKQERFDQGLARIKRWWRRRQ